MCNISKILYKRFIRFEVNSTIFLYELLNNLKRKNNIDKIIISGWFGKKRSDQSDYCNNYNIARILENLNLNIPIEKIENNLVKFNENIFEYFYDKKIPINKKYILLSNLGYNFYRIILWAFKKRFKVFVLIFDSLKLNFLKKVIFKFLGVTFIFVKKKKVEKYNDLKFEKYNFKHKEINLGAIINYRNEELNCMFQSIINQCSFVKSLLSRANVSLIVSNITIGLDGYLTEYGKKNNIPNLSISHGTISKSFNSSDEIYKRNIADAVFSGSSTFYSIQSKITEEALKTHKLNGNPIKTSNLIFAEKKVNQKNNKYILYAVTTKTFNNIQFLGVDMYFEFFKNLELLSYLSKENSLNFIIKLHPEIYDCSANLKKIFPNLIFSKNKIDDDLKKSFVTISYSSTVIEDSLHSGVPVILFDPWKRYKHCSSCLDPSRKNAALYYLTNSEDLLMAIKTVRESDKYNFCDYVYDEKSYKNISQSFDKILSA